MTCWTLRQSVPALERRGIIQRDYLDAKNGITHKTIPTLSKGGTARRSVKRAGQGKDNIMKNRKLHSLRKLKIRRKALRNDVTSAEATLWKHLQKRQLDGRKFRRQQSIGHYIVDFYCPMEDLVIELDGIYHYCEERIEYDKRRTAFLQNFGLRIIRFENEKVFENIDAVLGAIRENFKS